MYWNGRGPSILAAAGRLCEVSEFHACRQYATVLGVIAKTRDPRAVTSFSDAWLRFRNRVRFGLATQEFLDRLAKLGLLIYPYFYVDEPVRAHPRLGADLEARELHEADVPLIAALPERPRDPARIRAVMRVGTCLAIFEHGELVAYSWFRRDYLSGGAGFDRVCALPADCAYLFDAFVCRRARGRNVAVLLRNQVLSRLAEQGVKYAFSISLAFNRSTRRFKSKLGAVEVELRLYLRLKPFSAIDVRLRRSPWRLSSPRLRVSRPSDTSPENS